MKYEFESENVNINFHAFTQNEGEKERKILGYSIINVVLDFVEMDEAREIIENITKDIDFDRYYGLVTEMYPDLDYEDVVTPDTYTYVYSPDLDMFMEVYMSKKENKTITMAVYPDENCHVCRKTFKGFITERR